jgi:cation diffusion facilitator family transporter
MSTDASAAFEAGHDHVFLGGSTDRNERRTWMVVILCTAMMLLEIVGGAAFGSVALIADGVHMSTHAGAMLLAALAYRYARAHARDARFTFGTGKFGDLAAFASAVALALFAVLVFAEAVSRVFAPVPIDFIAALPIAGAGLAVNAASALLLAEDHHHDHAHGHDHGHDAHHHAHQDHEHHDREDASIGRDNNLRAAYVHVLADSAVSALVIVALLLDWTLGWRWMDPLMGMIGAAVIANWSYGLIRSAGAVLLDMNPSPTLAARIQGEIEATGARIADLHLWRLGPGHLGAIVALRAEAPHAPADYKARLESLPGLSHVTIEVEQAPR